MPRLHLADSKGKKRRKSSVGNSSGTNNKLNEFRKKDVLEHFSDFAPDEFDFDTFTNPTNCNKVKKNAPKIDQCHSTQKNRSPNLSSTVSSKQITIKDLPKKKSTVKSKKSSYTKLFNSSTDDSNENDKLLTNTKKQKKAKAVSFNTSREEPQCTTSSDEDLCDTDKENDDVPPSKSKKKRVAKKNDAISFFDSDDEVIDFVGKSKRDHTFAKSTATVEVTKSRPKLKTPSVVDNATTILPHRIVAVDNRALPSVEGDSMTRSFVSKMIEFLTDVLEKNILARSSKSCGDAVFVSLIQEDGSVGVRCSYLLEGVAGGNDRGANKWFSERLKQVNCCGILSNISDGGAGFSFDYGDGIDVDRAEKKDRHIGGFEAKDSWNHFGKMVEAACHKVSLDQQKSISYALSIFTTDAVMFADTNPESHATAFSMFWTCTSKFLSSSISSITIVIVDVTSAVQAMKTARDEFSGSSLPSRLQILQCINLICRRMKELSNTSVKIKLEFMDGSVVDFQTLSQMWTKESLVQTYQAKPGIESIEGKLKFELPETIDGTMCSISLDLQYTVLPDSLDSRSTMDLVHNMQMLKSVTASSVEVLQTIPLQSVDSSLIYGVPMYARPGLEYDLFQYNQMKILVRQLFKYLSGNDVALVLRIRCGLHKDNQDGTDAPMPCNRSHDQLFLLTSQVAVLKQCIYLNTEKHIQSSSALEVEPDRRRKGESPCNGILYRYATNNQVLHFGNEESESKSEDDVNSAEVNEYSDYIERSMDMLTCTGLNPFLVGENKGFINSEFSQSQGSNSL